VSKVISFTCLHYGKDYLGYALRSVIDHVDEAWVVYSPVGSHGFRTDLRCPDTEAELYAIARQAAGDKLRWITGEWTNEGAHREAIFEYVPDADVILVVDADEIWTNNLIEDALRMKDISEPFRRGLIPCVHFWRSFWRAITDDMAAPTRVIYPKVKNDDTSYIGLTKINHMGYAQRSEIVYYKQYTHGHKNEWRQIWFETKFRPNAQVDVHPTNHDYWNPVAVNALDYLPSWMAEHPYFVLDVIE